MATSDSTPETPLKRCSSNEQCIHPDGPWLPRTPEFFSRNKCQKDGFVGYCKMCRSKQRKIEREIHGDKIKQQKRESWDRNKDHINQDRRDRYANDPEYKATIDIRNKEYAIKNPELIRRVKRTYHDKHHDVVLARSRKHYRDNKEHHLARARAWGKEYSKTPRGRAVASAARSRRRARERSLPNTMTSEQWQRALDYFHGCCAVCGRQLQDLFGTHTVSADHWMPVSKGGGTVVDNIVPLCHQLNGCNNSKADTHPEEWLTERLGKKKAKQKLKEIEAYFLWAKQQT